MSSKEVPPISANWAKTIPGWAYMIADAMLTERAKGGSRAAAS